jgi:hypothetical protein
MAQTSTITSIGREFNLTPNFVGIVTTADLATVTTVGYWTDEQDNVELLNNGVWQWEDDDLILMNYSPGLVGFFTFDANNQTFVAWNSGSGLSNTLPSGQIFVGNGSNVATARALSGDATMANTGALTIANGAVTGAKIAANAVDYANLALDVSASATVTLSAAQIKALYDTPVQLIAAPGAGKLVIIDNILWDIAFGTTQYTAGGVLAAQYGNAAQGAGPVASGTLAAASLNGVAASGFLSNGGISGSLSVTKAASLNTAVYLSNQTADFATGDSTATLYVRYRVVTPA